MDDQIAKLRSHRDRLAAELSRLDEVLATHERLASDIAAFIASMPEFDPTPSIAKNEAPEITGVAKVDLPPYQPRQRGPKGSSPDEIATAAELVTKEQGRPMNRTELIAPIEAMGLTIGGYDKPRNLGTILWRSGRFDTTDSGYWPKGETLPDDPLSAVTEDNKLISSAELCYPPREEQREGAIHR